MTDDQAWEHHGQKSARKATLSKAMASLSIACSSGILSKEERQYAMRQYRLFETELSSLRATT